MCGIIGYTGRDRAIPYLITGLYDLEYRGYDSSGIALSGSQGIKTVKSCGRVEELEKKLEGIEDESKTGIGHTRWATHGEVSEINAHPHSSAGGLFTLVHNGTVENYEALRQSLLRKGVRLTSVTDTELIANLLEINYRGDVPEAIRKTAELTEGSLALGIICRELPHTLFAFRRGSPLLCASGETGGFIASDAGALTAYTDRAWVMAQEEICVLREGEISLYDKNGEKVTREAEFIGEKKEDRGKGAFDHYMLKEIYEQPELLKKCADSLIRGDIPKRTAELSKFFFSFEKICFIGCGSAWHAAMEGALITERLCGITCIHQAASEFRYGSTPVDERTLCVFISQSGETADTLAALRKAAERGGRILSLVNIPTSSMARESDYVLFTQAGPEIAVATTKAYTLQLMQLYAFSLWISHERWRLKKREVREYAELLSQVGEVVRGVIEKGEEIREHSRRIALKDKVYFIGRGRDYAAALEGSLKLKEISYIHTLACPAGELKHGTISLIEKGSLVIAVATDSELFPKILINIRELISRGAQVLVLTLSSLVRELPEGVEAIVCQQQETLFSGISCAAVMQLLSYYTALERGCDIDKPRNLAKSVTVE